MAHSFNTNLINVATKYINLLNIKVSTTTLQTQLLQNPYYPSLYSLSDTFSKYNITNQSFNITTKNLEQFEAPFIAYYNNKSFDKDFVLVTKNSFNEVAYIGEGNKVLTTTKEDFLSNWQQIVFVAETTEKSRENNFEKIIKQERFEKNKLLLLYAGVVAVFLLFTILFVLNQGNNFNAAALIIFILKSVGLLIASLLLAYEVDKSNAFVKNICTAGGHTNCDAVLSSKAAKLFGVSWSEAGFFYFSSTILLIGFAANIPNLFIIIAILSTAAMAYVPFSIYYQWKVVKQWCPLCLAVQAILVFEFLWSVLHVWLPFNVDAFQFSAVFIIPVLLYAIAPVVSWYLLKPILVKSKDKAVYSNAYKRLLYNPDVFNQLLQQQEDAAEGWQQLGITIGNPNATITILKVCNPYCGPCAKAHKVLEEIIHQNNNVKLTIIFTSTTNIEDRGLKPVQHLLAIYNKNNPSQMQQALDDWYLSEIQGYEIFAKKHPLNEDFLKYNNSINIMRKWCTVANITHTPTIFINGKKMPELYDIAALKNIF